MISDTLSCLEEAPVLSWMKTKKGEFLPRIYFCLQYLSLDSK